MKPLAILFALPLAACVSAPPPGDGIARARIGQAIYVDGPQVTPLRVLEDSRCPINARCVWAGRLRIAARIALGTGTQERELTLGEAISVADGALELVEAAPHPVAGGETEPKPYTFGFRFSGGL